MSEWIMQTASKRLMLWLLDLEVYKGGGDLWWYQITHTDDDGCVTVLSHYHGTTELEAMTRGLEAALTLADRIRETAGAELRKIKPEVTP